MTDSDGEIEYLEEDAEMVKQYVQQTQQLLGPVKVRSQSVLLVERPRHPTEKRKRKKAEDSDYDPTEEVVVRKRQPPQRKAKVQTQTATVQNKIIQEQNLEKKRPNIRIPDYDDPLCLPVRAIRVRDSDIQRLVNWNNVCLEHFKYCDEILKPERGDTEKSVRTAVFKNVVNKRTGSIETTIWSKTSVENVEGDKKSEIFQCVLPRYKEKHVLNNYILGNKKIKTTGEQSQLILSKEEHKDGEALVVYKPKESLSAVYGLIDKRTKEDGEESLARDDDSKMYLRELTCCKVCAPCYQGSWRGVKKHHKTRTLVCPICARTSVSIYNLLSHFKSHSNRQMRRYRKIVACILSEVVGYHYKCRICRLRFESIKALRQHTLTHQSTEVFKCEVGNHLINVRK